VHPPLTDSGLPPLYARWFGELLARPIARETLSNCSACVMLRDGEPQSLVHFHPDSKCCTWLPDLPNFLAGAVLADEDPRMEHGRRSVRGRIEAGAAVTPLGLGKPRAYHLLQQHDGYFGRAGMMACPHLVDGGCGIWPHRDATCSTWFCKYDKGMRGFGFWDKARRMLHFVERGLTQWAARELGIPQEALDVISSPLANVDDSSEPTAPAQLDRQADPEFYAGVWAGWAGREEELYRAAAALVAPLSWEQVAARCGHRLHLLWQDLSEAQDRVDDDVVPGELVELGAPTIVHESDNRVVFQAYSPYDVVEVSPPVAEALKLFDGRPTAEVVAQARDMHGVHLDDKFLRRLLDTHVLVELGAEDREDTFWEPPQEIKPASSPRRG
jgi:hypothetical protein